MNAPTPMLVLADSPASAERAAPFIDGDAAVVVQADSPPEQSDAAGDRFARIAITSGFTNEPWLSAAFARAAAALAAGGRVLLVLPRPPADSAAAEPDVPLFELPRSVSDAWRVIGVIAEHPSAAVVLTPAADDEGGGDTAADFRLWQLAVHLFRNPHLLSALDIAAVRATAWERPRTSDGGHDAELAEMRRQLDSYRNSTLGRVTTRYWELRRRWRN